MTQEEIKAEFNNFMEFSEESDRCYVTTVSALLFAEHIAEMERKKCAELCDNAVRISPTEHAKLFTEICADAIRARGK